MPIMFHALDCMRSNAFVASKKLGYKGMHKDFIMDWCQALRHRAISDEVAMTRRARQQREDPIVISSAQKKRRRMSHTNPELPDYRLQGPREEHHPVPVKGKPRTCTHCAYLSALQKAANGPAINISKSSYQCFACGDYLCRKHWNEFHQWEEEATDTAEV